MALQLYSKDFSAIRAFPRLFVDYVENRGELKSFFGFPPEKEHIISQIRLKKDSFSLSKRKVLADAIRAGYPGFTLSPAQTENLAKLTDENTFTISCGHQLNLAGGPMYVAFKILTVLRYCEFLNREFPEYQFVPLHWLANEDHDLDEISAFTFFGQSHHFMMAGTGASGSVSTQGLAEQLRSIRDMPLWMSDAYEACDNLNTATMKWLQDAFGEMGLLVLDARQKSLKESLLPFALSELKEGWVEKEVLKQTERLEASGYKGQLYPRPVNLFYLAEGERLRLERSPEGYQTHDGKYHWKENEALGFFTANPERLSPNVAFRPLYSQLILPDVAFVGGPAEISYWLQLKSVFEKTGTPFPVLIPRFSGMYVSKNQAVKMEKLGLYMADIFREEHELRKEATRLEWQKPDLNEVYAGLIELCKNTDPTLVPALKAELVKVEKQIEGMEKRIFKAAEQKKENEITQIKNLLGKLFPDGGLQERKESWLSFLAGNPGWLSQVKDCIVPFDFRFCVMMEEKEPSDGK